MTGRRTVVLLTLLGAGLVLLAGTRTWATVTVSGTLPGLSELIVPGRRSAPVVIAIALAAAAGAIVLATSGRTVRLLVAIGQSIAGAVVVFSGVRAALDTEAAVATAVADSLGVLSGGAGTSFGEGATDVNMTIWPWVAAAGGGVILVAAALTLAGGRSWAGPTRRYERATPAPGTPSSGTPSPGPAPATTWDALSRGEDPTSSQDDPT